MSLKITVPWGKKTSELSPRALSFPGSTPLDHLGCQLCGKINTGPGDPVWADIWINWWGPNRRAKNKNGNFEVKMGCPSFPRFPGLLQDRFGPFKA